MCGMISPTQPMTPAIATTLAVISVAATITTMRRRAALMPSARASSSPSESTLIRQRSSASGTRPSAATGTVAIRSSSLIAARLPSSQKVIAGSWS